MIFFRLILLSFTLLTLSHQTASGCSATVSPCNETCTISAPPQGSANCFTENGTAYCKSYDEELNLLDTKTASCSSGNGGPDGSGGDGEPDLNCQIYWWTCTQAY